MTFNCTYNENDKKYHSRKTFKEIYDLFDSTQDPIFFHIVGKFSDGLNESDFRAIYRISECFHTEDNYTLWVDLILTDPLDPNYDLWIRNNLSPDNVNEEIIFELVSNKE